jgi:hypothetical protein
MNNKKAAAWGLDLNTIKMSGLMVSVVIICATTLDRRISKVHIFHRIGISTTQTILGPV